MEELHKAWVKAFRDTNRDGQEWVSDKMLIMVFDLAIESAKCMFRKMLEEPKEENKKD